MQCTSTPDGGMQLDLEPTERMLFRYLVERASFLDTPPEHQDAIHQMAEKLLEWMEKK